MSGSRSVALGSVICRLLRCAVKSGNPSPWVGLAQSNNCVRTVLPASEVHRPNTTALDQKKSHFLSPSPQGAELGGGSISHTGGHVRQSEFGVQSTSGARPHSYLCSGGCGHPLLPPPAPPATPLPLSFLPTSLDFSKTEYDTAHHPQTSLHTSPARGKQPFRL